MIAFSLAAGLVIVVGILVYIISGIEIEYKYSDEDSKSTIEFMKRRKGASYGREI